jgi:hypothetical protein
MKTLTTFSATLRILTGLVLIFGAAYAGYKRSAPIMIAWIGLAFTCAYIAGKAALWFSAWQRGMGKALLFSVPVTWIIQTILVALFYLIGLGISSLMGHSGIAQQLAQVDYALAIALGVFGTLAGVILWRVENRHPLVAAQQEIEQAQSAFDDSKFPNNSDASVDEIVLLDTLVTPENFYSGIHYSHMKNVGKNDVDTRPNAQSAGGDEKIALAEQKIQVKLPEALRALYRVQNGGGLPSFCIPMAGQPLRYDFVCFPFSGYNDLYPLESLRTLHEAISDYADEEEEAERFPAGCKHMLILAQWYRETLYLDYNQATAADEPAVCFANFDDDDWQSKRRQWSSFQVFFNELRIAKD